MLKYLFSNPIYRKYREVMLCTVDLCIVLFSFMFSVWAKMDFKISDLLIYDARKMAIAIFLVFIVYMVSFLLFKVHRSLWKYVGVMEVFNLGASVVTSTCILIITFSVLYPTPGFMASICIVSGLLSLVMMLVLRLTYRLYRRNSENEKDIRRALIVGAGDGGYILLKELEQNASLNVKVVGFVDDLKNGKVISGIKVLGVVSDIPELTDKYKIQIIYIAIPSASKEQIRTIYNLCEQTKTNTKVMKQKLVSENLIGEKIPVEDISIEDLLGRGEVKLNQQELKSYITGQKILVTGAGGSIGSELCRQILNFNPKLLLMLDINENALYMLEQEFNRNLAHGKLSSDIEIRSYITSIRDREAIDAVMNEIRPDVVYHAAAHKHVPLMETKPKEAIKNNVFGTNNVILSCIEHKVKRFIMISTDKAVNPTNVMGATKRMTELILQSHGNNGVTKLAAVRFGNVLGSNGSVIPIFKKQISEGGPVTLTDKNIIRYFMTIPEAAQLVLQAGFYADKGEIFVLDMGEPVKILDLAEKMIRLSGLEPNIDIDIKEIGLRPGEKMFEELRLDGEETIKTKNDLIFKNLTMPISIDVVNKKLDELKQTIHSSFDINKVKTVLLEEIKETTVAK
ncbi:MAG: nucleoside-diphosphate sugar epimerase/dehydratase [Erysipelotrichaceae bacterium]